MPSLVAMRTINLRTIREVKRERGMARGGDEDWARGIDVHGSRNSMNRYRLAAHFASRSCDGLVKRFGLSSPTLPTSLFLLLLLLQHQYQHIVDTHTLFRVALFFSLHAIALSRGGSKANQRGSRSLGIFETKDESRGCVFVRDTILFHETEEGG